VSYVCLETNFKSLFERQIRFARTIKSIDPVGYAGSIVTHPLALAVIGAPIGGSGCFGLAVLALGCRIALCLSIERAFRLGWQRYWLLPILDLLAFAVYLVSFTGATVSWRDHRYRVSQGRRPRTSIRSSLLRIDAPGLRHWPGTPRVTNALRIG
jgi:ceramide glucosyltransferase